MQDRLGNYFDKKIVNVLDSGWIHAVSASKLDEKTQVQLRVRIHQNKQLPNLWQIELTNRHHMGNEWLVLKKIRPPLKTILNFYVYLVWLKYNQNLKCQMGFWNWSSSEQEFRSNKWGVNPNYICIYYTCVCMSVYACMHVCAHLYVYICMYVRMHVFGLSDLHIWR